MKMNASKREYGYDLRACMQSMRIETRDVYLMRDIKLKEDWHRGQEGAYVALVQGEAFDEAMNAALDSTRSVQVGPLKIEERKGYWAVEFK